MKKVRLLNFIPLIIAAPPVIIGVIVMYLHNVAVFTVGQNIFCLLIGGVISSFVVSRKEKMKGINTESVTIFVSVILLFLTLINSGMEGVHRWISLGPIKFYVASIVLPIVIIKLWGGLVNGKQRVTIITTIIVSLLLLIQPDASQLTAFIIPMIILIWNNTRNNIIRFSIAGALLIMAVVSWVYLDALPPVSYVEEILSLAANTGIIWFVLGVISLVILPLPFIIFPPKNSKLISRCIGIYFIIILISTQFGNFPIPLMGYGISPIIGYFIAITWLVKDKVKKKNQIK
ncbi:MAG: cell division protein [Clostridium beijerinckii]|nr:cell division protein [Clostridium beijerinckii]